MFSTFLVLGHPSHHYLGSVTLIHLSADLELTTSLESPAQPMLSKLQSCPSHHLKNRHTQSVGFYGSKPTTHLVFPHQRRNRNNETVLSLYKAKIQCRTTENILAFLQDLVINSQIHLFNKYLLRIYFMSHIFSNRGESDQQQSPHPLRVYMKSVNTVSTSWHSQFHPTALILIYSKTKHIKNHKIRGI